MTQNKQDAWERFERWAARYENKSFEFIEKICSNEGNVFADNDLFIQKKEEVQRQLPLSLLSESALQDRITDKIGFLRAYLVDISFDGPEFMNDKSNFLSLQYPGKCDNALGVWLEKDGESLPEDFLPSDYFDKLNVSFFCKNINDVDLASMYSVLPFDRMFLRRPKGRKWDKAAIDMLIHQIKEDLEFDYSVKIDINHENDEELLMVSFIWDPDEDEVIEKSVTELQFVEPRKPIPTVEIDIDSIPEAYDGYSQVFVDVLHNVLENVPDALATIYVFQGQSVNFGSPTFSAYFGVAGKKNVLDLIVKYFRKISGIKVRLGEYISTSSAICEFHIQDGYVWRPVDAVTWSTVPLQEEDEEWKLPFDDIEESEIESKERNSYPRRYRAARRNAKIGSIKKVIEEVFGLPSGSVSLCGPDGKKIRADATIGTLRKRWDD